ncbi:hypothetical protein CK203_073395 [Vitis vinifera]|uniref:Uncharacterized protein n=1 Tax=Vitis vinifera TaxID=29760 RepID=A0A438ESE6_VITVI|nr:hypothetical protein CK203_073395 [Vitis vinifera]
MCLPQGAWSHNGRMQEPPLFGRKTHKGGTLKAIPPLRCRRGAPPIDGTIIFPPVDPTRILHPYCDALILSLEIEDFDVRRILVDPGSSADLVQASVISHMGHSLTGLENPGRILSGFKRVVNYVLGRHCTAGPS